MTMTIRRTAGAFVALALSACVANTGDEIDTIEGAGEESARAVRQALTTPQLTGIWSSTSVATCPGSHPHALGSGAQTVGDGEDLGAIRYPTSGTVEAEAAAGVENDVWSYAICSNAAATTVSTFDSDGSATATCPSGKIAVGGGGVCSSSGARLYRTRPSPDTAGSIPAGWTSSCNTGGVTAYARCIDPDATFDFTSCRTRKSGATGARRVVTCPSGEVAVAVGGYCGTGNIWAIGSGPGAGIDEGTVWCDTSTGTVNAYAICCDADAVN